jgi:hypothetical protein
MIQRVSKHSGYIEMITDAGERHSQVGQELKLFGWGPNSYAVSHGSDRHVTVYNENNSRVAQLSINPEYKDLHWDGSHLTFVSGHQLCTMDMNGTIVNTRPL